MAAKSSIDPDVDMVFHNRMDGPKWRQYVLLMDVIQFGVESRKRMMKKKEGVSPRWTRKKKKEK